MRWYHRVCNIVVCDKGWRNTRSTHIFVGSVTTGYVPSAVMYWSRLWHAGAVQPCVLFSVYGIEARHAENSTSAGGRFKRSWLRTFGNKVVMGKFCCLTGDKAFVPKRDHSTHAFAWKVHTIYFGRCRQFRVDLKKVKSIAYTLIAM